MLNFEAMGKRYRERIQYRADELIDHMISDHLLKGGEFDAQKITKMFGTAVRIAQLLTDLEIGTGLDPCPEETNDQDSETPSQNGLQTFTPDTHKPHCRCEAGATPVDQCDHEVCNFGEGNPEGPTGGERDEVGVCYPDHRSDQANDNRPAGSGEINLPEQQSVPAVTRPGTGWGHSGGPEGS